MLEESANPFAVVVMAHLKAQATRKNPKERSRWKLHLVKGMYERDWSRQDILDMFRFIDWIMALPPELEQNFKQAFQQYEQEKTMQFITSFERDGMIQNAREYVLDLLELRFGEAASPLRAAINRIEDTAMLKNLHIRAATAGSIDEFCQQLPASN